MITKNINSPSGKKYEEITVPGIVYDDEPIEGSFNGITSDAVVKAIDEAKEDMQEKIDEVTIDPTTVALGNVHLLDEVTEFPADGCILIDSETNGPGEMSKDTLLELTAQNTLAGNVAQAFIPNSTTTVAGHLYVYEGLLYVAKVYGYQGPWDSSKFEKACLSQVIDNIEKFTGGVFSADFESGYLYQGTTTTIGDTISFTKRYQEGVWECTKTFVKKGCSISVKSSGDAGNIRAYYVVSMDNKLLAVAYSTGVNLLEIMALEDCYVYVNNVMSNSERYFNIYGMSSSIVHINELLNKDEKFTDFESGYRYVASTATIGDTISFSKTYQAGVWECTKVFVKKGLCVRLKSSGDDGNIRAYYVVSMDNKLLAVADDAGVYALDIFVPEDCYVYVNNIISMVDDKFVKVFSVCGSISALANKPGPIYRLVSPEKIYTVCNDIGIDNDTVDVQESRQYSASVGLDNMIYDAVEKQIASVNNSGIHKIVFDSILNANAVSGYNPQINNDTLWQQSDLYEKNVSFTIDKENVTIKHLSVRNTKTSSKHVRLLCIGDSVTASSYGNVNKPYANAPQMYWEWIKCFFELDRLQNGGTGYDCVMLGNQLRSTAWPEKTKVTFDIDFGTGYQENDVVACACGRDGASTDTWMSSGSPFYNPTTEKFSLQYWVENYRTLIVNNDGSVTRCDTSNKGSLAPEDTTAYNVCEPTHILIQLGYNQSYNSDGERRTNYLADIGEMIDTIKTEYPDVIVMLSLPDNGGTYYPEDYPQYTGDLGMPNPYDVLMYQGACKTWHDKFAFMNQDLMAFEDVENGVYYVPTYFTSIGLEQVPFRVSDNAAALSLKDNKLEHRTIIGWSPHQHPNNAGHAAIGYEIYSLVKYTLLDQE